VKTGTVQIIVKKGNGVSFHYRRAIVFWRNFHGRRGMKRGLPGIPRIAVCGPGGHGKRKSSVSAWGIKTEGGGSKTKGRINEKVREERS